MDNSKITLSCVTVTWNSSQYIEGCLTSLVSSLSKTSHEIIVVDNVSSDKTCEIIRKKYPKVILMPQKINWGFGQGNNIATKKARGKFILLLNPDTKVNKKALGTMIDFFKTHKDVGAVGPEQLDEKGSIRLILGRTSIRGILEYAAEKFLELLSGKYRIIFAIPYEVSLLNLGCVMVRSEVFDQGFAFDPKIFLYGEEYQLANQLKRLGYKLYFLRNCYIYHYREKSTNLLGKRFYLSFQSVISRIAKRLAKL